MTEGTTKLSQHPRHLDILFFIIAWFNRPFSDQYRAQAAHPIFEDQFLRCGRCDKPQFRRGRFYASQLQDVKKGRQPFLRL